LVYAHGALVVLAGALVIADVRIGGLLMAFCMAGFIATKDNPMLAASDASWRLNF